MSDLAEPTSPTDPVAAVTAPSARTAQLADTIPPDLGPPHRIILIRHGQTAHTVGDLISGSGSDPQPDLDGEGLAQARAAAARLSQWVGAVDRIVTSPLPRARQTAQEVARGSQVALTQDASWTEAHFGSWESLSVAEVVDRFPGQWEAMIGDPLLGPPQGESLDRVRRRVIAAWDSLGGQAGTTVVVTHLTPIRIVLAHILGTPHESFGRLLVRPGSLTVIDRWADAGAVVITVGERG